MKLRYPIRLGTTFSQLQCKYLGLDYKEVFTYVCRLPFDVIRLGSYWDEIEPVEGKYQFEHLDWLLDTAEQYSREVVLTVGMKAPRWPEYHFPKWVQERFNTHDTSKSLDAYSDLAKLTLNFTQQVIRHTRQRPSIRYWQIENEPLSALGVTSGRYLSYNFIKEEVALARRLSLPGQRILLTNSINMSPHDSIEIAKAFEDSLALADAVGINVYTKVPSGPNSYHRASSAFWRRLAQWREALEKNHKEAWVAEAQAEPWEEGKLVAIEETEYPSATPQRTTELVKVLAKLRYQTVLLWGCEHWYWHRKNGNPDWWDAMECLTDP